MGRATGEEDRCSGPTRDITRLGEKLALSSTEKLALRTGTSPRPYILCTYTHYVHDDNNNNNNILQRGTSLNDETQWHNIMVYNMGRAHRCRVGVG